MFINDINGNLSRLFHDGILYYKERKTCRFFWIFLRLIGGV